MNKKMIVVAMMLFLVMASVAAADIDWSIYDLNDDGTIDAEERVTMDIDVENGRISLDEFAEAGVYTITDSSVIVTGPYDRYLTKMVSDPEIEPVVEQTPHQEDVVKVVDVPDDVATPNVPTETPKSVSWFWLVVGLFAICVIVAVVRLNRKG